MKKILLLALACVFIVSCDDSDDGHREDGRVPIVLSTRLTVDVPRVSRQDVQIAGGQQVSFFVTRANTPSDVAYDNALLTADGKGGFSYDSDGDTILYYPVYTDDVDFYAIHPYSSSISLGSNYNFSIQSNQSNISNFLNSDLLYVRAEDISTTRRAVQLVFDHKLSKVSFVVIAGEGTDLSGLTSVEILNTQPQVQINTTTGALAAGAAAPVNVNAYGFADGYATITPNDATGISAIVPPQVFPANQGLFRLTVDGVQFTYTPSTTVTFLEGTSYRYRLTLTATGITVVSSINPWLPTDDQEGEGIIE